MKQFFKFILLFLFIISIISCYSIDRDCKAMRTGKFYWEEEIKGETVRTEFTRTDDFQLEYFENRTDSARVEWINDCEWRLIPLNPQRNADSRTYLFKIINTSKNSYTFEFRQSGKEDIYTGTAIMM